MVVLSLATLGLTTLTASIMAGNAHSNSMTTGTILAQDRLEIVKRLGLANAASAAGTESYGSIANHTAFKRVTTISANTPGAGLTTATVTVYWNADARSVSLASILAQ